MGRNRDQALVDEIAADIIKRAKLRFELDGPSKERHFFVDDEDVSRGMVWVYANEVAQTEDVVAAVAAKTKRLHPAVLGQVLATGTAIPDVGTRRGKTTMLDLQVRANLKQSGAALLRELAGLVLIARIYDLLERDEQPLIREAPED